MPEDLAAVGKRGPKPGHGGRPKGPRLVPLMVRLKPDLVRAVRREAKATKEGLAPTVARLLDVGLNGNTCCAGCAALCDHDA